MNWLDPLLDDLASRPAWGYQSSTLPCSEPTALVALALLGHDRKAAAEAPIRWLLAHQHSDGSVGISDAQPAPYWPTSYALLAWQAARARGLTIDQLAPAIARAADWLLSTTGIVFPSTVEIGHDSTLHGWPWVASTHSWLEPTAWSVIALKATGHDRHPRVREAVQLLIDRLLPDGGCNYGNSFVFGAALRPHVAPSGLALLALTGESDSSGRVQSTIDYLGQAVSAHLAATSLSYALVGLAAHHAAPVHAQSWISAAACRMTLGRKAPDALALLALAALAERSPLIPSAAPLQVTP